MPKDVDRYFIYQPESAMGPYVIFKINDREVVGGVSLTTAGKFLLKDGTYEKNVGFDPSAFYKTYRIAKQILLRFQPDVKYIYKESGIKSIIFGNYPPKKGKHGKKIPKRNNSTDYNR